MKQQSVVTQGYSHLQGREKSWPAFNIPTLKHVIFFYENIRPSKFCGHNNLTETVFVTHLSTYVGISVWRIVWVTKNCVGRVAQSV